LAKTGWYGPPCDVHVGKALGQLSTLEWVHEFHLGPFDIELDAERVLIVSYPLSMTR